MQFSLTPGYFDIYGHKCNDPQEFLKKYSSVDIITYLSIINAQLCMTDEGKEKNQLELFKKLTQNWPKDKADGFLKILSLQKSKYFLSTLYITYFIHQELLNFKSEKKEELNSYDEYQVLKAYFAYIDKYEENHPEIPTVSGDDPMFFQKLYWPRLINQFDFNDNGDPLLPIVKLASALEYFYLNPKYSQLVKSYLEIYNRKAIWNLIMDYMNLVHASFKIQEKSQMHTCLLKTSPEWESVFQRLAINVDEYKNNSNLHKDFLGIRQKPLIKIDDEHYVVMSWRFLYNSIYIGSLMDLNEKSGFNNYPTLKSIVGKEVSENVLFKSMLTYAMKKPKCKLHFGENEGEPDGYIRIGKYIFLLEFKDYLVSTEVVAASSFETFKNDLDLKFIQNERGKSKGITQLKNQIKTIDEGGFDFDKYEENGIKKRNLVIFPIIITTHFMYQIPGVNSYLENRMNDLLVEENLKGYFKKVYPVTILDFMLLYKMFIKIHDKDIDLRELIAHYHDKLESTRKKFKKAPDPVTHMLANAALEELLGKESFKGVSLYRNKDFAKRLFEAFNLSPERTNP